MTSYNHSVYLYKYIKDITGPPYEEMDGKFYVDHNGSLRTITWKDDDIKDPTSCWPLQKSLCDIIIAFLKGYTEKDSRPVEEKGEWRIIKKMAKWGRKEQHLPDSCLQTAMEHRESWENEIKQELSASDVLSFSEDTLCFVAVCRCESGWCCSFLPYLAIFKFFLVWIFNNNIFLILIYNLFYM